MTTSPSAIRMLLRGVFGTAAGIVFLIWLSRSEQLPDGLCRLYMLAGIALTACGVLCLTLYFLRRR